ncbi:MAG: hypothetical protein V4484_18720 [Pseudomonadota bacterium]
MRHALSNQGALLPSFVLLAIAVFAAVAQGKDLNWDQLNYHFYISYAFLTNRLPLDFMAASVQSYLNPLAHLPFYFLASSHMSSAMSTALLGALHGMNFILVYAICRTLIQPGSHRSIIALVFTGISISHPVVVAELGTSFAELVASLPVLAGIWILMKLDGLEQRKRLHHVAAAFFLLGAGGALKLPYALFGVACFPALLVHSRQVKVVLVSLAIAGAAAALGFGVFAGFPLLAVWKKLGNPFFPFFNNIFVSPYYPAVKLVNDRFLQSSVHDMLTLPWRMLVPTKFVTTERMVIDPRYLVIASLALALPLMRHRARLLWKFRRVQQNAAPAAAEAPARPLRGSGLVVFTVFAVSYPLWCVTSGNGRYALPLHLLSGAVLLALLGSMQLDRKTLLRTGTIMLVLVSLILAETFPLAVWTRSTHTARWYDVLIPDAAKVEDALYLSAGFSDRTSNSFLIPQFPATAKFGNVNGYGNLASGLWSGKGIDALIANQGTKPIFILAEGWPGDPTVNVKAHAAWVNRLNLNLQGFGLAVGDLSACHELFDRNKNAATPFASVCPLVKTLRSEARLTKVRSDAALDRVEAANPTLFYPRGELSYFRAQNDYCRFYASTEYYLCERQGALVAFRTDPSAFFTLGKLTLND